MHTHPNAFAPIPKHADKTNLWLLKVQKASAHHPTYGYEPHTSHGGSFTMRAVQTVLLLLLLLLLLTPLLLLTLPWAPPHAHRRRRR